MKEIIFINYNDFSQKICSMELQELIELHDQTNINKINYSKLTSQERIAYEGNINRLNSLLVYLLKFEYKRGIKND